MALPPTSSKLSSDANEVTTFKFDFPHFTGTHTGTLVSLDVNSVAGGGTGLASLTANNVILGNGTSSPTFVAPGASGNILTSNGTTWVSNPGGAGTGTVTSVALSDGSTIPLYAITGSPITTAGTLTFSLNTQSANTLLAGPTTGAAAQPAFRSLVAADLNTLIVPVTNGGTSLASLTANNVILGNGTSAPTFVAPGTAGNSLVSNGTTWISSPLSISSAFAAYASSAITGTSSTITGSSFQTFSNSPAFTFTPTITGTYKVYSSVPAAVNSSTLGMLIRIFNTSGGATLLQESQATVYGSGGTDVDSVYAQSTYTLTAGTTYVFDIQGSLPGTGNGLINNGLNTSFYMFAEGIALTDPIPTGSYASGGTDNTGTWSTNSTSFVDGTNSGGNSFTPNVHNNIILTASAGNEAGISFTPANSNAVYLITASSSITTNNSVGGSAFRLVDANGVLIDYDQSQNGTSLTGIVRPIKLSGVYVPGTASPITVKIQMASYDGDTATLGDFSGLNPAIFWNVVRLA